MLQTGFAHVKENDDTLARITPNMPLQIVGDEPFDGFVILFAFVKCSDHEVN